MNNNRYSRQMLFSPIQQSGQNKLAKSSVLIVGVGALGTVASSHLVRSGIGKIRIVDRDYVELSNLQRQMLFDEEDVSSTLPKAIAAKNKLEKINSTVTIEAVVDNVTVENIEELTEDIDVVIDGTDNFTTRHLLNDICFKKNIPFSYGGVVGSRGMTAFLVPNETPCLRCLIKTDSNDGQTCDTVGVIAPAVDTVSSLQVTEALKYLTDNHEHLNRSMQTFDLWFNQRLNIKFSPSDPSCLTCGQKKYPSLHQKAQSEETTLCGRNTVQIHQREKFDLDDLEKKLINIGDVQRTPFLLKVVLDETINFVIFPDGRVLVQGTEDTIKARTWYDRYIGS